MVGTPIAISQFASQRTRRTQARYCKKMIRSSQNEHQLSLTLRERGLLANSRQSSAAAALASHSWPEQYSQYSSPEQQSPSTNRSPLPQRGLPTNNVFPVLPEKTHPHRHAARRTYSSGNLSDNESSHPPFEVRKPYPNQQVARRMYSSGTSLQSITPTPIQSQENALTLSSFYSRNPSWSGVVSVAAFVIPPQH
jgi:hypothetical protein